MTPTDTPRDPREYKDGLGDYYIRADTPRDPLAALRAKLVAAISGAADIRLPDGRLVIAVRHAAAIIENTPLATRPSGDAALRRRLHDQRWACSEDRDSCDPAANPAFHDAQLASIGLLSETALSGYGSISAIAPSGSRSGGSGSPSGDEALRAAAMAADHATDDDDPDDRNNPWQDCPWRYRHENFADEFMAALAAPVSPSPDVLDELTAYAKTHAALSAGRGSTDDVLGFIDWYRALLRGSGS